MNDQNRWAICDNLVDGDAHACLISPRGRAALRDDGAGFQRCVRHHNILTALPHAFVRMVPDWAGDAEIRKLWKKYQSELD